MSDTPETSAPVSARAPGEILRRAREAKNLSIAAIATQMNLDLRTVEALEQGDLSRLPAPIFVRGYLRGFARLVDVPEAEVLGAYQAQAPQEPTPRVVGARSAPLRPAFRMPMLPWRGLLLMVALLALAWLGFTYGPQWLRQITGGLPDAVMTTSDTAPATGLRLPIPADAAPEAVQATPPTTAPETAGSLTSVTPATAPATATGSLELALPAPQAPLAPEGAVQPAAVSEPPLPSDSDFGTAAANPPAAGAGETAAPAEAASSEAAPAEAAAPPAPGELQLEFTFSAESWVEVRSADRDKLLFGLYKQGEARSVTGKAPIAVLLGNAQGVALKVNGKPFDLAPRSRDNIARFELKAAD